MANLKEIRGRITSISSTMQITSAMKMVAAAKLKKAQDAIVMLRPYSEKLTELIENVSANADPEQVATYTVQREVKNVLYIVITSNRGLAGAFNSSVVKELNLQLKKTTQSYEILTVGKKVYDAVWKNRKVYDNQSAIFDHLSFDKVSRFTAQVMKDYTEGKFDQVFVIYNKFINAVLRVQAVQLCGHIFGRSVQQRLRSTGNFSWHAARLGGECQRLLFTGHRHALTIFQLNAPYLYVLRQLRGSLRIVRHNHLHGDNRRAHTVGLPVSQNIA